jgi:superfamily II DNA or RNA helicase
MIIIENIKSKEKERIDNDIQLIDKQGLNARPETDEGRVRLFFRYAQFYIDNNKDTMVYYTLTKINDIIASNSKVRAVVDMFSDLYKRMNDISDTLNRIKLQINDFHHNMPPLNEKGFVKLDDFQKQVIQNIRTKRSMIVKAPTSAGKSIMTSYLFAHTPGIKVLFVVPTDILAWQIAAMIGKTLDRDIPLVTSTYKSCIELGGMLELIHTAGIFVGTPSVVMDLLPHIKIKFDWVVVDEIHMIGSERCKEMEPIIKFTSDSKIMALSATIGNINFLRDWFITVGHSDVDVIECNKRFFNQQRYSYRAGEMVRIHPLSTVSIKAIEDGSIKTCNLMPTPPDIWDLSQKLDKLLPRAMKISNYFSSDHRITLDEINEYFDKLIDWMVSNVEKHHAKLVGIIESYIHEDITETNIDLYDVAVTLRDNQKIPALAFQTDSHKCLELVRSFSHRIRDEEEKAFPNLRKERLKAMKMAEATEKEMDRVKFDEKGEKQMSKLMMEGKLDRLKDTITVSLNEPHPNYIINHHQPFNQDKIDEWYRDMKMYFPHNGSENHYLIDLLWRGIGVYCKGLPDPYLHLVQNLACSGKLGFVFSDDSLVYGVSMPFRTVVITKDENILYRNEKGEIKVDGMTYLQEVGRAGRRGLDKEGNTLHVNYTWEEVQKLVTCKIPHIVGRDTMFYGAEYAKMLSGNDERWNNIKKNFLLNCINDDASDFYKSVDENLKTGWKFATGTSQHFRHMMWRFRHSEMGFRTAFILNEIRKTYKYCNPKNENTQVEFAKLIAYFVVAKEASRDDHVMTIVESSNPMLRANFKTLGLDIPEKIDSRVYEIIRLNSFIETDGFDEKGFLRNELFEFGIVLQNIQHYFYHSKEDTIAKMISKLMTRVWWNYYLSSPVMEPISRYVGDN